MVRAELKKQNQRFYR